MNRGIITIFNDVKRNYAIEQLYVLHIYVLYLRIFQNQNFVKA